MRSRIAVAVGLLLVAASCTPGSPSGTGEPGGESPFAEYERQIGSLDVLRSKASPTSLDDKGAMDELAALAGISRAEVEKKAAELMAVPADTVDVEEPVVDWRATTPDPEAVVELELALRMAPTVQATIGLRGLHVGEGALTKEDRDA